MATTNTAEFEQLDAALDEGIPAVIERMIEQLRERKRFHHLFEALKLRLRYQMGLPLWEHTPGEQLDSEVRDRYEDGLIEACRERARPIVMTSMAMAAGMLPTALALEKGAEFRQPMAVAVIGGLITSTLLSLVLVPVVYEFVDDFESWIRPKFARLVTPREAVHEPAAEDRP